MTIPHSIARASLILTPLLLSACATTPDKTTANPPPAEKTTLAGPVTYETSSWGRMMLRWQVNPDGTGEIWRGSPGKGAGEVRKFHLTLEGAPLGTFAAKLEDLRKATTGGIACKKEIYDLPYGSVTWDYPAKQTYAFDAGCRSDAGAAAMETLRAATTIIETVAQIEPNPYVTEPAPR